MTGTAKTEEEEFKAIYKMDVVQIPTNKPILREDLADSVYKNELGKDILEPYCLLSKSKAFDEKVLPQTIIDHLTCK